MQILDSPPPKVSGLTSESFAEAYHKGYRSTVRFLVSKGLTMDAAEETAQSAWARGWEARGQLQMEERLLPWINSIAYRGFCNAHRHARRQTELTDMADVNGLSVMAGAEASLILSRCSAPEQVLLTKRYLQGMELKEIAASLGVTEINVRVRLHRCQKGLRARIGHMPRTGPDVKIPPDSDTARLPN